MAKVPKYVPGTSDESVRSATGKTWTEWFRLLDDAGAEDLRHKQIVAWLRDEAGLASRWWQQNVTVEFEKARGKRAPVGETADAGFQVGAQRTIDAPVERVWKWLTTAPGRDVWLGRLEELPLVNGQRYETLDASRTGRARGISVGRSKNSRARYRCCRVGLQAPCSFRV